MVSGFVKLSAEVYRPRIGGVDLLFAEALAFYAGAHGVETEVSREFFPAGGASGTYSVVFGHSNGERDSGQEEAAYELRGDAVAFAFCAVSVHFHARHHANVTREGESSYMPDTTSLGGKTTFERMKKVDPGLVNVFLARKFGENHAPGFTLYRVSGVGAKVAKVVFSSDFRTLDAAVRAAVQVSTRAYKTDRLVIVDGDGREVSPERVAHVAGFERVAFADFADPLALAIARFAAPLDGSELLPGVKLA